jgi:hypothetical protein
MLSYQTLKRGLIFSVLTISPTAHAKQDSACRCFAGDECWPSVSTWDAFNQSIDGRLIKTEPLATPCHTPNYNRDKCKMLKDGWFKTDEQYGISLAFSSCTNIWKSRVIFVCYGPILYQWDLRSISPGFKTVYSRKLCSLCGERLAA